MAGEMARELRTSSWNEDAPMADAGEKRIPSNGKVRWQSTLTVGAPDEFAADAEVAP